MKSRILLLLFVSIVLSGAADAATTIFFDSSQTATLIASGATSDTISSNGYLFTYTRDKLFGGGTGRPVRVPWPEGVEAQAITVAPVGKAQITISRVDGNIFDIPAFTAKLLANTAGAGAAIEVMPQLNGEDGYNDPIFFSASGQTNQTFSYDTGTTPQSTALLTGFDTYKINLYVDFALTAITLVDAGIPNTPPVANDNAYATNAGIELTIAAPGVLGNDTDADGDPLTAILNVAPFNGTLTLNPNGSFTYTPDANFIGLDTFTYHANDGADDSNIATVTITVNPPKDPPVANNALPAVNSLLLD